MEKQTLPSVCTMDCPDTCSLDVDVTDGRITEIRGSHLNPVTAGFICSKIANFTKRVYSNERLLHPMRRVGPKGNAEFEEITWDEAVETIRARFSQESAHHNLQQLCARRQLPRRHWACMERCRASHFPIMNTQN